MDFFIYDFILVYVMFWVFFVFHINGYLFMCRYYLDDSLSIVIKIKYVKVEKKKVWEVKS